MQRAVAAIGGTPVFPGVFDATLFHFVQGGIEIADAEENGFFAAVIRRQNCFAEAIETELEQALENCVDGCGDRKLDVKALDDFEGLGGI